MMNGIYKILMQYSEDIKSKNLLFNILSKQKHALFSIAASYDNTKDIIVFKTMNAMHDSTNRFSKMIQNSTYDDTNENTYINVVIS